MIKTKYFGITLLLTIIISGSLSAQQINKADSTINTIKAIAASQVTAEISKTNALLFEKQAQLLSAESRVDINTSVDTLRIKLKILREDPRIHNIQSLNFRSLGHLKTDWENLNFSLQESQNELSTKVDRIENDRLELEQLEALWKLSLAEAQRNESPESVLQQIRITVSSIQDMLDLMRTDSQYLQDKLVVLSNNSIFSANILEEIESSGDNVTSRVFEINQEPLWRIFKSKGDTLLLVSKRSYIDDLAAELQEFSANNTMRILLHALFVVLIFFVVISLNRNIDKTIPDKSISEIVTIRKITGRPYSVSILLGFLGTYLFYQTMPASLELLNTIILLVPVVIILSDILPKSSKSIILIPLISLVLIQFHSLGYSETLFSRLYLLAVIIMLLVIMAPLIFSNLPANRVKIQLSIKSLFYILVLAFILLLVGLIAAIAGAVILAEYLCYAIIKSAALILIIYALRLTLNSTIYTLLYSRTFQTLNLIAQYHSSIYKKTEQIINLLSWILWLGFTMQLFSVWDEISTFIRKVLTTNFNNNIETSFGDLLLFIVILIITFWISKLIKIIINGEIAPRIKMKRGVPGALSLLFRIGIITIGFIFAASAAGFGMDRLTILIGALGVGIGFGLQNIFNNLVSGIILAFERPIQEGDIIEVGELWGTVKEIGIRSSTLFTFDGAEVIVPNGNLISKELINWTLTDRNRRVEAIVGVAYGTDPELVLGILNELAANNKEIMQEPAPLALFSGFGESSLDFRLLFWIHKADNRFLIQSEINVAVNNALKAAGIEIPFPQHDLHVRSVDKDIKLK